MKSQKRKFSNQWVNIVNQRSFVIFNFDIFLNPFSKNFVSRSFEKHGTCNLTTVQNRDFSI